MLVLLSGYIRHSITTSVKDAFDAYLDNFNLKDQNKKKRNKLTFAPEFIASYIPVIKGPSQRSINEKDNEYC